MLSRDRKTCPPGGPHAGPFSTWGCFTTRLQCDRCGLVVTGADAAASFSLALERVEAELNRLNKGEAT